MFLPFKVIRKLIKITVVAVLVYLAVTFVQVAWKSRQDEARKADAIVVFGAAQYNGRPSAVLRARLDHAADLYDDGIAPMIVVTGGSQPGDETTEASASADYLASRHAIGQDAIVRENQGRNSWQSMAAASRILRQQGRERVVLVTDPFHAARVDRIAKELGLEPYVSPTRTSPISGTAELGNLARETVAVAVGQVVGFRRLVGLDDVVSEVREGVETR